MDEGERAACEELWEDKIIRFINGSVELTLRGKFFVQYLINKRLI